MVTKPPLQKLRPEKTAARSRFLLPLTKTVCQSMPIGTIKRSLHYTYSPLSFKILSQVVLWHHSYIRQI